MRILVAAVVCLGAAVAAAVGLYVSAVIPVFEMGALLVVLLASLFLLSEGGKLVRREQATQLAAQAWQAEREQLLAAQRTQVARAAEFEADARAAHATLAALESASSTQRSELQRALADAEQRALAAASAGAISREQVNAEVLNFLALLQQKGRFIDFLMDDITAYDDASVGAAARIVHQGCAAVMREHFKIAPICSETAEGHAITLDKNFDPLKFRLVGRVVGVPPFRGTLVHRGWRTSEVHLPHVVMGEPGYATREIIAPAEVELS